MTSALLAALLMMNAANPAGTCGYPNAFTSNPFTSCFVRDYLSSAWVYDSANSEVDYVPAGSYSVGIARAATSLGVADGHARVRLKAFSTTVCTVVESPHTIGDTCAINTDCGPTTGVCDANRGVLGISFRNSGATGPSYYVGMRLDGVRLWWVRVDDVAGVATTTQITSTESCAVWVPGETLGVQWSGTGAGSTTINVWHNPSGDWGTWGAATCTLTDCTQGGTVPTGCVDTGNYVGMASDEGSGLGPGTLDDFEAAP